MNAAQTLPRHSRAFTLIEVMLSTAIISLILLVLVSITNQTSATWRYTTAKIEQFRQARNAFDTMTTRLSQATLNTYWDYFDAQGNPRNVNNLAAFIPYKYGRQSELLFVSGPASTLLGDYSPAYRITHSVFFHAPLGLTDDAQNTSTTSFRNLNELLNVWGYFVEFRDDSLLRPSFITTAIAPARYRFRLMEFMQPTQNLQTYVFPGKNGTTSPGATQYNWFKTAINANPSPVHVLAENIVALIIHPQLSPQDQLTQSNAGKSTELAPNYSYDTRYDPVASKGKYPDPLLNPVNQLPPILQVTMVAIDEQSATRLNLTATSQTVFNVQSRFTNPANYTNDLLQSSGSGTSLEDQLIKQHVNYRIFTTNVPIRGAKWSRAQTN